MRRRGRDHVGRDQQRQEQSAAEALSPIAMGPMPMMPTLAYGFVPHHRRSPEMFLQARHQLDEVARLGAAVELVLQDAVPAIFAGTR